MWLGIAIAAAVAGAVALWSLFEAQWVELVEREVPLAGLPAELAGFRILHLSDPHLGTLSLNGRALARAVRWAEDRDLDLVAITGDLLSRRRGERALAAALAALEARHGIYAVLGNHDVAKTRDPFAEPTDRRAVEGMDAVLLSDSSAAFESRGRRVQVVGVEPLAYMRRRSRPANLADPAADLRILLCHFPNVVDRLPPGAFQLVLAGHLHGGQICVPYPGGKIRLEHLRAPRWEGLFRTPAATLYVSRGLGTSFVPFRFFARPEATVLTLTRED